MADFLETDFSDITQIKSLFSKIRAAELPLYQVFWTCFFLVVFLLKTLGVLLPFAEGFFGLLALLWAGLMVLPVIRAAGIYTEEPLIAVSARVTAIFVVLILLLDLFF